MEHLHTGARWIFRIRAYSFFVFFGLFLIFPLFASVTLKMVFSESHTFTLFSPLSLVITCILFSELYARLAHNNWKFELTPHELKLERGIIWKKYSAIPYERVQNVDITRGILARMMGFSSLNVQTAGYSAVSGRGMGMMSEGYIPAVSVKKAEDIREFLIKKISKKGI